MAQKTQIKKDKLGLYVIAGGWISRPFYGTIFKEGDEVKTHHFGGSTNAGVTFNQKELNFKNSENYEFWSTTGVTNDEYLKKEFYPSPARDINKSFDEILKSKTEWYKHNGKSLDFIYKKNNLNFKNRFKSDGKSR